MLFLSHSYSSTLNNIEINGNNRISDETIKLFIDVNTNEEIDNDKLNNRKMVACPHSSAPSIPLCRDGQFGKREVREEIRHLSDSYNLSRSRALVLAHTLSYFLSCFFFQDN